jgi:hypothetical protein
MKNTLLFLSLTLTLFIIGCSPDDTPNPEQPSIIIQDATVIETDNDQTVGVTVTLNKAAETNVVFNYSTIAGTALSGVDFEPIADELFTINAGETTGNIEFVIKGDNVEEGDETFEIAFLNPVGGSLVNSKITVTISDDDVDGGVQIPSGGYDAPATYPGFTLIWEDNFDGTALGSHWTQEIGRGSSGWGNNELQYYRAQNTTVANGYCIIEAKQENFGGANYTSSRMITKGAEDFKYGRIDIRAALPEGQGIWPALWMLGANIDQVSWPNCGEIDIMEVVGHQPNKVHGTLHWGDVNGNHAQYGGYKNSSTDLSEEFNVYSIIWTQTQITWLLNNVQYHVININEAQFDEFRENFFFIMNVAVGGNWPGSPDATTAFPQRMIVDYIRVHQQ